ncbi:MAG: hypothetical protein B1H40_02600 [Candidatus Latescibacteria bacterium 4484_181]|nr:MAG: hypothetical protein B1H40_02600 [Candidatus Latescibacteria bacterium 4484_181]RKY69675.1 MAG: hypothetical protein DRQ02_00285 [Candidatus Latescibacterota bacterium]RKY73564.1 MAG: hypothetical protein DRQ24_02155 [Candidatus Latescibacterota bacterium]
MSLAGEIGRKLIHLCSLAIPIGYLFLPRDFVLQVIILVAAGSLTLDLARLRNRPLGKTFLKVSKPLLKKDERARLTGSTYLLLASVVCVFFFDRSIAIAALLFLSLGDPMASFVGRRAGRTHIGKKTLEGSLACLGTCLTVGVIISILPVLLPNLSNFHLKVETIFIGALTATVVELLPLPLDDNALIPMLSGLAMQIVVLM